MITIKRHSDGENRLNEITSYIIQQYEATVVLPERCLLIENGKSNLYANTTDKQLRDRFNILWGKYMDSSSLIASK